MLPSKRKGVGVAMVTHLGFDKGVGAHFTPRVVLLGEQVGCGGWCFSLLLQDLSLSVLRL